MVSQKEDTGAFSLQEMVNSKLTRGMEQLQKPPQMFFGGVALSSRRMRADGSCSRWDYQSIPWLPFTHLRVPTIIFPKNPVQVGESWRSAWEELRFTLILTFAGFQDVLGYRCAEIKVSIPEEPSVKLEGTLFFALKEGFWVQEVFELQERGTVLCPTQLVKAEQLSSDELQREKSVWNGMMEGEYIPAMAFSPDGKLLASSSEYGITLWIPYLPSLAKVELPVETKGKLPTTWGRIKSNKLYQNYPNPFNPDTWIPYQLAEDADVTIRIYNITGQLVRMLELRHKEVGFYLSQDKAAYWDGRNEAGEQVASGIYFYHLEVEDFTATRKMLLLNKEMSQFSVITKVIVTLSNLH